MSKLVSHFLRDFCQTDYCLPVQVVGQDPNGKSIYGSLPESARKAELLENGIPYVEAELLNYPGHPFDDWTDKPEEKVLLQIGHAVQMGLDILSEHPDFLKAFRRRWNNYLARDERRAKRERKRQGLE